MMFRFVIHMPHTGPQEKISTGEASMESPLTVPAHLVAASSGSLGARGSLCVAHAGTHTNATTLESSVCVGTGRIHQPVMDMLVNSLQRADLSH